MGDKARRIAIAAFLVITAFAGGLATAWHWPAITAAARGLFLKPVPSVPLPKDIVAIEEGRDGGFDHFLGPHDGIRTVRNRFEGPYYWVSVSVVVSPEGEVIDAKPIEGAKSFFADAVKVALRWRFIPFQRGGKPVYVRLSRTVDILPLERRPDYRAPFPAVKDFNSVVITLQRTGCFGDCPAYRVAIKGDGTVEYTGRAGVAIGGRHTAKIPVRYVRQLVEAFRTADYFWLFDEYNAAVTDSATFVTSIAFDGRLKRVTDYVGTHEGMPAVVRDLEAEIDRVADTARWLRGNRETAASLVAEKFDFSANTCEAKSLLAGVVHYGASRDVVRELIHAGAVVNGHCEGPPPLDFKAFAPVVGYAVTAAAARGDYDLTLDIIDAGGRKDQDAMTQALVAAAYAGNDRIIADTIFMMPHKPDAVTLHTALVGAASACSAPSIDTLVEHGAVIKGDRETVLAAVQGNPPSACAAVVTKLAKAGAAIEARDAVGDTPLLKVFREVQIVKALIAAGADVNVRDNRGKTVLMGVWDRDVALALLQAGADPALKDPMGRTTLQVLEEDGSAREAGVPAVVRDWMAKHQPHRD